MPAPPSGVPGSLEEAGAKVGEDIIGTFSPDQDDSLHWCPPRPAVGLGNGAGAGRQNPRLQRSQVAGGEHNGVVGRGAEEGSFGSLSSGALALPPLNSLTLGMLLTFSHSQFLQLLNRDNNNTHILGFLRELNDIMLVASLVIA